MKTKVNVLFLVASFALAVVGGTVNLDSSVERFLPSLTFF